MEKGKPFVDFSLHPLLQSAVEALGFENCTPIQDRAMPHIMDGQDVAGLAQTGTGKTAAFMLPMIERIMRTEQEEELSEELQARVIPDWQKRNFVLVLVPTRELAEQVKDCAKDFLKDTKHNTVVVYGGVSMERQIELLNKDFTFLVATPGRLIDLYKNHKVDLKQVRCAIFDEADRMFDMGFKDDMKYILRRIPDKRQLLMFSATLNFEVFNVAYQFGSTPVELNVSLDQATAENVEDKIFHVGRDEKPQHLLGLFKKYDPKLVIIFTNFKNQVDRITTFLNSNGYKAVGISSLITQSQRKNVMTRFKEEGGENILVATDVAARGLDIDGIDMVVNFELSDDAENYVHRIGRTGRAGESGNAYSFVSDKDVEALERIEKYLDKKIEADWMESEDLPEDFKAFPRGDLLQNKNRTRKPPSKYKGRSKSGQSRDSRGGDRDKRNDSRSDRPKRRYNKDKDGEDRDKRKSRDDAGSRSEVRGENSRSESKNDSSRKVHRDKRSGRHRSSSDESSQDGTQNKKRRNNNQRRRNNNKRRPQTAAKAPAKKQGFLGKVMKKLFGK